MTYRLAEEKDTEKILAYYKAHNMPQEPILNICFIAETDDGQIQAVANAGYVCYLESFISDNPIVGHTIFAMTEGALKVKGIAPVMAGTVNDAAGELLLRLGYEEVKDTRFFLRRK